MAFKTQQNAPLTGSQKELTAKIGSMKSLLSLPFKKNKNIPKDQQISTFDYLLKILKSLGLSPEIIFRLFIELIFSKTATFLEEKVLEAVGASLDAKDITLSTSKSNADVLKGAIPATFLQGVKQAMAKELTVMIFGPKDGPSENLVPDAARRNELISQAVCGSNIFSLSNNPTIRNEDIEFNRVQLKERLEKGEVVFEISCQNVKIKMPEDPGIFFGEGGVNTQESRPVSPAQSVDLVVNHVKNETGKINNEKNANSAGKSFYEILIEKLMSFVTTLVSPGVINSSIFSYINGLGFTDVNPSNVLYGNCSIESNPSSNDTLAFSKSLINSLYKELIKMLLLFAIKNFKKVVANYFARTALEKQRRKSNKIKMKFGLLGSVAQGAAKALKYAAAIKSLETILGN